MATTAEGGGGEVLRSERIAGGILPPVLNTFDMVAIFVAIVLLSVIPLFLRGALAPPPISTGCSVLSPSLFPVPSSPGNSGACFPVKARSTSGPTKPSARSWASSRVSVPGGRAF